jgi:hypothetical protein
MNPARRRLPRLALLLAAATALVGPPLTGSAEAHHGYEGPARLYLATVRLDPGAAGWLARAALNDTASGKPAPGFLVEAVGSGPGGASFGPALLADSDADGRYEGVLGTLPAGDWSLTLHVGDLPGGEERVIPLTRTWTVTLQPGQPLDVLARRSPGDGGAPDTAAGVPLLLGIGGGAAVLGVAGMGLARRRRHPAGGGYEVHHA